MKKIFLFITIFALSIQGYASNGDWKSYTSKKQIRSITYFQNFLWAATSGGILGYNLIDSSYKEFTTSEGLKTIDLSSIAVDNNGTIWIGADNGYIHSYNPFNNKWNYFTDIFSSNLPQKSINNLYIDGDTLFISSSLGVSVFIISKNQFGDSFTKFGFSPQLNGKVNSVIIRNDTIWVATDEGIASAWRSHPNLSAPQTWNVYRTAHGLPSNYVASLSIFNNSVFAATNSGLARFNNTGWQTITGTNGKNILSLSSADSILYFISSSELMSLNLDNVINIDTSKFQSNLSSLYFNDGKLFIGTSSHGVTIISDDIKQTLTPPSPPTNRMIGLAVDENGYMWAGTGTVGGQGFIRFDGTDWYQYNIDNFPEIIDPHYYRVDIGVNNSKWISGWRPGVVLLDKENQILNVFNTTNGLPPTLTNDTTYVVAAGVVTDQSGNAWINVRTGRGDTVLAIYKIDSTFSYVKTPITSWFISEGIAIDNYDTKWLWTGPNGGGIFFYNERDTIRGMISNTRWGNVKKINGLSSDNITVITIDNDGEIWVGTTDAGINIIYDPKNPLNRIASYYPLRNEKINDIKVDVLNQKWIATPKGVYVLSQDGTSILEQYTVQNTSGKLLNDNVLSIAINKKNGLIYFATEKGLSTLQTNYVLPVSSFDKLLFTPNPYLIPSENGKKVKIEGLVKNSIIKILTIDGKLINEIQTPGGNVGFWDGKDANGNYVSSGIYLITAYPEDGSSVGIGKIAVIRK